ncbi:subtilisin-like protease SBT2.5 [Phalaenopsis equestris]|uniref:subtilisin-like protease SBT2.5 n=1 Tax=Phalaenopsis equestris TaxID=78828 RepID=UPI0009E33E31|nr:subtilisin-like protease SBT2.5 [Phalaenopsis equestris]
MGEPEREVYYVFMNHDPQYERLRQDRSKKGVQLLNRYLSNKHKQFLAKLLLPNSYNKKSSLAIVDGFAVEITQQQAEIIRSAKEVRVVDKNMELPSGA